MRKQVLLELLVLTPLKLGLKLGNQSLGMLMRIVTFLKASLGSGFAIIPQVQTLLLLLRSSAFVC